MAENDIVSLDNYKPLQILRNWLRSDISISKSETLTFAVGRKQTPFEREGVTITINIQNTAPETSTGVNVVFLGVGLRITDGREGADSDKWVASAISARPTDRPDLRSKYNEGAWVSVKSFPELTDDERSFGEVLFPGESVVYELKVPPEDLPYLDIKVEGALSRRHLLHVVQSIKALTSFSQPVLVDTFRAIDAIDIFQPLLTTASSIPELGSRTTLAEIEALRNTVDEISDHVDQVMPKLNKVYHSAPNQKLRDYMKQEVGKYLTSVKKACDVTLQTLSGSDTKQMSSAAEGLKNRLLASEEVKSKQIELMSIFGLSHK